MPTLDRPNRRWAPPSVRSLAHDRRTRPVLAIVLISISLLALRHERDRAHTVRNAWNPSHDVWMTTDDFPAGHRLEPGDVELRALPSAALPADPVNASPVGQRLHQPVGEGEILREQRLRPGDRSAAGSTVGDGRGAVAITAPSPHLEPGDRVDLYDVLTGDKVATGGEVISTIESVALVAVADLDISRVIRSLATGDVVSVLVG